MAQTETKKLIWIGRIISTLVILFLLFDVVIHFLQIPPVVESFAQLGYPMHLAIFIAIIESVCLALYIFPKTSVLGAILLTGYLGGAVASNLRIGLPLFSHILFPVYTGIFVWGGLFLRNKKIRDFIPFTK